MVKKMDIIKLFPKMDLNLNPSHECAICENLENPKATVVTKEFWICDDCIKKLRKIVFYSENGIC